MRRLAKPDVLKSACLAAAASAFACYPRFFLWTPRPYPVWYLEGLVFLGGMILWAFVFAWHVPFTGRPVFTLKIKPELMALASAAGVGGGMILHLWLDPWFRHKAPEDYPVTSEQWIAMTLFTLAFTQLFLVFAPFAWLMRLCRNARWAVQLTVLFGVVVLLIRIHSASLPASFVFALVVIRLVSGYLTLQFYLRGGVLLAWWWAFLIECRHLWALGHVPPF